jgi:hypothetical protein
VSGNLRQQLETGLTSDLVEDAKLVWCYLVACRPQGVGAATLADTLGVDVPMALEVLGEAGMIKVTTLHHGGAVVKPVKYALAGGKAPKKGDAPPPTVSAKTASFIKVYQRLRKAALGRELQLTPSSVKRFQSITEWMAEYNVGSVAYLKFALERSEWMGDKMPFPTPAWLAGDWIRDQWLSRSSGPTASGTRGAVHAGKTYAEADASTEAKIKAAGLSMDGVDDAILRYIESCAAAARDLGEVIGVDAKWVEHVKVIAELEVR